MLRRRIGGEPGFPLDNEDQPINDKSKSESPESDSSEKVESREHEWTPEEIAKIQKEFLEKLQARSKIEVLKKLNEELWPRLTKEQKGKLTEFYMKKFSELREQGHSLQYIFQELVDYARWLTELIDKQEKK